MIRQSQKKCTHCKQTGHTEPNCREAAAHVQHLLIRINNSLEIENIRDRERRLYNIFHFETLHSLCLLIKSIRGFKRAVELCVQQGQINAVEARMRTKLNRIAILMWIFFYSHAQVEVPNKRLNIKAVPFCPLDKNLTEFDCPICVECKPGSEQTITDCDHVVCKDCLGNYFQHQLDTVNFPKPRCSMCRADIKEVRFQNHTYVPEFSQKYLIA
jgi:hypothetical protein